MTPFDKIKPKHLQIILHGTDDLIDFNIVQNLVIHLGNQLMCLKVF